MPPNDTDGGGDEIETLKNEERGCGFLEHGKAYFRSPPSDGSGHLPAFVRFDPPVPYLERSKFRGYEYFPGVQFEASVTGGLGVYEGAGYDPDPDETPDLRTPEEVEEDAPDGVPSFEGLTTTDPVGELHRHIKRLSLTGADGEHAGEIPSFKSHDLYQHIGASYYSTPEEFIDEVREQGLSKAIPASESHEPPRINPGRTRLFLVHTNATSQGEPGVIGYVYLHRVVYTETKSGQFPAWVQEEAAGRPDFEPVRVGDRIHSDGKRATKIGDEWTEVDEKDADPGEGEESEAEAAERVLSETFPSVAPEKVVPSDKPGRDVEGVPVEEDEETPEDDADEQDDTQPSDEDADDEDAPRADVFDEATVVEVPRPDSCPGCGAELHLGSMRTGDDYGDVEVRVCREEGCGWDNSSQVNAALTELDLRDEEDYNSLRSRCSARDVNTGRNPDMDALVRALLDDMGVLP